MISQNIFWNESFKVWKSKNIIFPQQYVEIGEFFASNQFRTKSISTNSFVLFLDKNFVKVTFLLRSYTVWKSTIKRNHDFYGKKINIFSVKSTFYMFYKDVTKALFSRTFFFVIAFFSNFPHPQCGKTRNSLSLKKKFVKSTI